MKHFVSLLCCALIIGAGVAVVYGAFLLSPADSKAETASPESKAVNVRVQVVQPSVVEDVIPLTGRIEPWEHVTLSAETGGKVEWRAIEENQPVKQGDVLFRIDTTTLQTRYDQAAARQRLALQEVERLQHLQDKGASSPQSLDRAVTERDVAAADLSAMKIQLDKSVVKAPFDGVIDKLFKKQGEFVDTGMPLVTIIQVHKVKAVIGLPEYDSAHFALKDSVNITLDAFPEKTFDGVIHKISASADAITRTFTTEVMLDNEDGSLKPGMTVRARLVRQRFHDAIVVPIFSIISMENQRFVVVEEEGVARMRPIEVGVLEGSRVQVTKGLAAGEHLIVTGQREVRDGDKVNVMPGAPE